MIEEETWSRRGWRWGEAGRGISKIVIANGGVYNFQM